MLHWLISVALLFEHSVDFVLLYIKLSIGDFSNFFWIKTYRISQCGLSVALMKNDSSPGLYEKSIEYMKMLDLCGIVKE